MTAPTTSAPKHRQRWWLWLPLLGLAGWLALYGDKSPANNAAAPSLPTRAAAPGSLSSAKTTVPDAAPKTDSALPVLVARDTLIPKSKEPGEAQPRRDLFNAQNWNPPPPPSPPTPTPLAIPPTPKAPAIPYSFLGKKLEDHSWEVYLSRDEKTYIAREGQVLEGTWRVDKIAPPSLSLTYLPLDQSQTHSIGDAR